ncbi:MAG TPA: lysophospholipid acyltransferase family protein [Anaerolineae bacterium]|nr:lysophospholipid acyltransferase family protein [Anaerolineae bacterium]
MRRNVWYSAGRAVVAAYMRLMIDLDIAGPEPAPPAPQLIVANHPSTTDPFYLPLLFHHPIDMLLIDSAFRFPLLGAYLRRAGQVCVTRDAGTAAFVEAQRRLEAGRAVAIFPEGNISPREGGTLPLHTGAARLALLTGVPVVPVGIYLPRTRARNIRGRIGRRPLNGYWYLRGPYAVTVGRPLRFCGNVDDAANVAAVTQVLMEDIHALANESERRFHVRFNTAQV